MARPAAQRDARIDSRADAAEAILDAAEVVFAENGFRGATTRAIGEGAGMNPALIHYYFGSKDALFDAVIARRAGAINGERRARLAALHAAGRPTLEQILDALLRPTVALGRDPARGGAHYARLLAHSVAGTDERSKRLGGKYYDDIATIFIDEIAACVPHLSRAASVRGYLNAIAISISLMAPTGRAEDLSEGALEDSDLEEVLTQAVDFSAAGIRALARTVRKNTIPAPPQGQTGGDQLMEETK